MQNVKQKLTAAAVCLALALSAFALWRSTHVSAPAPHRLGATVVEQGLRLNQLAPPNAAVAMNSQKLTGLANGTTSGDAVQFLQTAQAINAIDAAYFCDGTDGQLTAASGTTTLAKDTCYSGVTLTGTAKIDTAGFRLFVSGTTDLTGAGAGAIFRSSTAGGAGAAGGTAGSAGTVADADGLTVTASPTSGTAGGAGGTTTGAQATAPTNRTGSSGGASVTSGKGGTGASGAGGATRAGATVSRDGSSLPHRLTLEGIFARGINISTNSSPLSMLGGAGGPGGGGGGGDGTAGGGGGGGGGGGHGIYFATKVLAVTGAPAGVIQCVGAAGGQGGTPAAGNRGGGGGGSGGGGGWAIVIAGSVTGSVSGGLWVDGGAGGNGGNGTGTGIGGDGGGGAAGGYAYFANLQAGTFVTALGVGGSAGTAGSGTTGGTGAAGEQTRVNF